ncbi:concanavalin A-like lectin/glucanase domain-containing protein [Mycena rosella]|uniref:Concanavalin A-like lectin/glucanase domain-containing protein n=1 Tax=Mycena rosella TaxID=1033263 RepID=A0AAD7DFA5_MYCRO|nr:concanavalin A-like lectin/glucanase domain-containing protein [Mycena rosella]
MTRLIPLALLLRTLAASATYYPFVSYSGATFFDGFDFYGAIDNTTWGNVSYVTAADAQAESLAFINSAGNAVIKVDDASTVLDVGIQYRKSVRLTSKVQFPIGTLFVIDAVHMPYGCSVWPSIWLNGVLSPGEEWPAAGEIDLIEAINLMDHNQMALHSFAGCMQPPNVTQTGSTLLHNCNDTTASGCTVAETKPNSFGSGFANAGGGAFGLQFDAAGVFMWFWGRANIPASITNTPASGNTTIDLTDWGIPSAAYPAAGCNITEFFPAQELIIDITLCGLWAGVQGIYASSSCPGTCFGSNIAGNGSNYAEAYFELPSIRTWSVDSNAAASASASIAATAAPTTTASAQQQSVPTNTPSSGRVERPLLTLGMMWALGGLAWLI